MSSSRVVLLLVIGVLLWTSAGLSQEVAVQSGGTAALESAEASLELSRSERRRIQMGLAAQGFDPGPADGLFGRGTRGAIREWQASRGEAATGYLDADAAKALLAAGEQREAASAAEQQARSTNDEGTDSGTEILRDKYILGLSRALKADDYPKALGFIEKLEELGGDLPPSVDYFRGEAYFHTERYDEATRALKRYVEKTGREGRYYQKSLELMLVAEEKAEAERVARAARAKAEAEAREKTETLFKQEIEWLVALISVPYSGSGSAKETGIVTRNIPHCRWINNRDVCGYKRKREIETIARVKYNYHHRLRIKWHTPTRVELICTDGCGSVDPAP